MTAPQSITFIHSSDLQLGMTRWFLEGEAQARFDDARLDSLRRLGDLATREGAAFIVIAGDVFDSNSLSPQTTGRALEALRGLPVPVYLLPGNHDPLVADSVFKLIDVAGVHLLSDTSVVQVADGVELVGAPLRARTAASDLVRDALEGLEPTEAVRIMVGHGQAEARGNDLRPDLIDLGYVESRLADGTIDYLALGDTHSAQPVGTSGRVWFSGSPEVTDFRDHATVGGGETNSGRALVVEVSKGTAAVREEPVGQWTFEALDRELMGEGDVAEFLAALDAYPDKQRTVIKYGLRGTLDMSATRALEEGLEARRPVFAALFERGRLTDLHLEPGVEELDALGVSGFADAALKELVAAAGTDPTARDAVNLFFRLARED
ncbi:DNA repair exonuclease SbcCD nuclease subunit [Corynebacterium pollutisoli]|uniref:Nuclease SbcCD subunit D n=1 Tax=Corynebacterium pollutisoli TaxID=1610489 RepID=A0A1X7JMM0_9CORY|nr:exonuclease SbcCD subunit D [Corynebacterium pollutisoli]SMG28898.1 DNA repair exonuclease SbcCD nuclease subunit [Corynebacterium pollutisoli]